MTEVAPLATTWVIASVSTEGRDLLIEWDVRAYMPWPSLRRGAIGSVSPRVVHFRHTERISDPDVETVWAALDIWSKSMVIRQ